jgi:hypothetical protein
MEFNGAALYTAEEIKRALNNYKESCDVYEIDLKKKPNKNI